MVICVLFSSPLRAVSSWLYTLYLIDCLRHMQAIFTPLWGHVCASLSIICAKMPNLCATLRHFVSFDIIIVIFEERSVLAMSHQPW